ncbi:MAG: hypothetical protein LC808_40175 [Actinobacteria bacterium]|nr:hypothetical protein [Actinomycetota bacterium]
MISRGPSVHQTSHQLLCDALRGVLRAAVQAGPGAADGIGTVACRAVAALFMLLMSHPVDRRGRCRSCRRPGAVFGRRWRRCRVHVGAGFWLHQPDQGLLLRLLADELTQHAAPPSGSAGSRTTPAQTPAVPPPPPPRGSRAGRPDPDHGGAGETNPEGPRPRRDPPLGPPTSGQPRSLLLTGEVPCRTGQGSPLPLHRRSSQ